MIKKIFISSVLCVSLIGGLKCQPEDSNLPVEKVAKVYVDLLVAKELHRNNPDTIDVLEKEIFEKYSIDSAFYKTAIENFKDDKKKWDKFFAVAKNYLDSLRNELTKSDSVKKIR